MAMDPQHKPSPTLSRFRLPLNKWTGSLAAVGAAGAIWFAVPAAPTNVHVAAGSSAVTCDQTFSTGNNAAIIAAVAANPSTTKTLCLNSGNYGDMNLWDITRSAYVTIRSTTGVGAQIGPDPGNSDFIRLESLTIVEGVMVDSCSTNIQIVDNVLMEQLILTGNGCGAFTANYLVEGNSFNTAIDNQGSGIEGQLQVIDLNGSSGAVIIRGNTFDGVGSSGCADGIQISGTTNLTIGPDNRITNHEQAGCSLHVDGIQLVPSNSGTVIEKNYFENNSVNLALYDGVSNLTIRNNILNCDASDTRDMQMGDVQTASITHNTWKNCPIEWSSDPGDESSNIVFENNILDNSNITDSQGNFCGPGCILRYNLLSRGGSFEPDGGSPTCSNCVTGNATYVGGGASPPATWAGWQLDTGSPGENAGNDGNDMGTTYYGP
jgi:hypothetical protein